MIYFLDNSRILRYKFFNQTDIAVSMRPVTGVLQQVMPCLHQIISWSILPRE